jgi:hypothetical protein
MSKIKKGRTLPIILKVPQAKAGAPTPVGKVRPMLSVVPESGAGAGCVVSGSPVAVSESLIDEIRREGARRMLAEALRAEVETYVA